MNILINKNRLWKKLEKMSKIGPGKNGGNNRQALTYEDSLARKLFVSWCEKSNLKVSIDEMGNIFGEREGKNGNDLPVYMGSHLDTQPTGGKFDGVLGVLGALEVIDTLNDLKIETKRPIVVVNWTNEEGSRFSPPMMSSGVFAGIYTKDWAYNKKDKDNIKFIDDLKKNGMIGNETVGKRKMHCFFELHIEQGPILENEEKEIGIVTRGQGLIWIKFSLNGQEAHSGTTPMNYRKNAGLGFIRISDFIHKTAMKSFPEAVATIGNCYFYPNSPNIIPGKVDFIADIRSPSEKILKKMEKDILKNSKEIASELNLSLSYNKIANFLPVSFDKNCIKIIDEVTKKLGYSRKNIVSGAGHDAFNINRVAPTGMIMCPCKGGLSHNEKEEITTEWAEAGTNVLLHSILKASNE